MGVGCIVRHRAVADDAIVVHVLHPDATACAASLDEVLDDKTRINDNCTCRVVRTDASAIYALSRSGVAHDNRMVYRATSLGEGDAAPHHIVGACCVVRDAAPGNRSVLHPDARAVAVVLGHFAARQRDAFQFRPFVKQHAAGIAARGWLDDRVLPSLADKRDAASDIELCVDLKQTRTQSDSTLGRSRSVDSVLDRLPCLSRACLWLNRIRRIRARARSGAWSWARIQLGNRHILCLHGKELARESRRVAAKPRRFSGRLSDDCIRRRDSLVRHMRGISRADRPSRACGVVRGPCVCRRAP